MSRWKKRKQKLRKNGGGSPFPVKIDERRVAILTPACDMCHTGYAMSLAHMLSHTYRAMLAGEIEPFAVTVNSYGTSILPFSRQILAKTALEQEASHTLWIDSDMEFPGDMLIRFMRHDEPIVGINAMSRRKPYRNTAQTTPGNALSTTLDSTGLEHLRDMAQMYAYSTPGLEEVYIPPDVVIPVINPTCSDLGCDNMVLLRRVARESLENCRRRHGGQRAGWPWRLRHRLFPL